MSTSSRTPGLWGLRRGFAQPLASRTQCLLLSQPGQPRRPGGSPRGRV